MRGDRPEDMVAIIAPALFSQAFVKKVKPAEAIDGVRIGSVTVSSRSS